MTPPSVQLLTTRVAAGRPTIVLRSLDSQSGVDPVSLTVGYHGILVGAASYDPVTGVAVFPLPATAPALESGAVKLRFVSSDYQEAKNIDTVGPSIMPNTRFAQASVTVVAGTAVDWIAPVANACLEQQQRLVVAASSTRHVSLVRFTLDGRRVAVVRHASSGLWSANVPASKLAKGRHTLRAVASDSKGAMASARRIVRVCHK